MKAKRKNSTKRKSLISSKKVIAYLAPKFSIADWKKYDAARKKLQIKNEVLVKPRQANDFKVKAGQFFSVGIPDLIINREYSVCSGENENQLELELFE